MRTKCSAYRPQIENLEGRCTPARIIGVPDLPGNLLRVEHADIGIAFEDGQLEPHIHNHSTDVEFAPAEALFLALPSDKQVRPAGSAFDFTGADAGANLWLFDNTPITPGVLIGFAAEEILAGTFATYTETDPRLAGQTAEFITITLKAARGPGHFSVWDFDMSGPRVWMSTAVGGVTHFDKFILEAGSHNDMNFGFSKPGRYEIDLQASAFLGPGQTNPIQSAVATYSFSIQEPLAVTGRDAGGKPMVRVFNAHTGKLYYQVTSYSPAFRGGVRVATGDVNGDGFLDIVTVPGAGIATRVRVFDGFTGQPLAGLPGGFLPYGPGFKKGGFVAVGDVVAGGGMEIIVGPGRGRQEIKVFDAAGVEVPLPDLLPFGPTFGGGIRVAAGNLDGIGADEIVAASGSGPALVKAYDSAGTVVRNFGVSPIAGGVFVAVADVNGDGAADILTGRDRGTQVRVFDGTNPATVLADLSAYASSPGVRIAAVEVNGDDRFDLLVGSGRGKKPLRVLNSPVPLDTDPLVELAQFLPLKLPPLPGVFVAGGTYM